MPEAMIHPTPQELTAFGLGKLPERAAAVVAAHLGVCPDCRQAVAGVLPDSFLDKVRDASPGGSSFPPNPPRPDNAPSSAGRPATPAAPLCPNLPPELANHPKYQILRELGHGGMGVVYQARQIGMMVRPVVIKVVSRALLDNPDALERFLREVQAAAQLSHPNIVTAYDAEQAGELRMLVMEFVPGQNLAEVLQKKGPLPVATACQYARQAAWALQHAYERGMVHRDIKPQNLMLTPKGQVKVLDFGLAKVVSEQGAGRGLTSSNSYMGTPEYSAPEQATDARTADIRADLYSLGCTLYCLLAGRPPFREDTAIKTILAHLEKQPQPLAELRSDVPERLWAVVSRLLAKEPGQRYQKPLEVVQALTPFVKSGAKPEAKSGSAPVVRSPGTGTMLAADTGQIQRILREVPGKTPAKEVPAKDEASPFADLRDAGVTSPEVRRASKVANQVPTRWSRCWPMLAGGGVLLLALLGMWAVGGFKGKGKTADGEALKESSKEKPDHLPNSITNSIGMKLVLVQPGTFLMGSPVSEAWRSDDESQHEVEITRSFYVGVYEVTQEQYERIMGQNPSWFSSTGSGKDKVKGMDTRSFPVENVTWNEAVEFCRRLSERPDEKEKERLYRLPTEAEWEYICRGGPFFKKPSPPFSFGNSLSDTQANFDGNYPYGGAANGVYLERPTKVSSYPPNSLGLHDLHGNVWEWCTDWYDREYYKHSPRQDPQGPAKSGRRVLRGGFWGGIGRHCRSAFHLYYEPGDSGFDVGFRVVLVSGARTYSGSKE